MKSTQKPDLLEDEPSEAALNELTIRVADKSEYQELGEILDREHYIGDLSTGRQLLQVIEHKRRIVAILDWGPASKKLAGREEWIGWTSQQRAERLALIAMNRRFCILSKYRMPNLASKCLSLSIKALPDQWKEKYGYSPVLAETFTDIEQFHGTCYKANNWVDCHETKGFRKSNNQYHRHGKPKKLWLKTLNKNTKRILTAIDLPKAYEPAVNQTPERDLSLKNDQMLSLRRYLAKNFKDPRRVNRSYPASSLFTLIVMAILAGRTHLSRIHKYGQFLTTAHREALDFPPKKDSKGRKAPSYSALRNLLQQTDPHEFAKVVSAWLQENEGSLAPALAVDGKWVRDKALSVCLSDHETGVPIAVGYSALKKK